MSKDENTDRLLNAVLFGTPDDARRVLKSSGGIEYTGRALGAACRFRGLDMVKALVESGAEFTFDYSFNTDMVFEFDDSCIFVDRYMFGLNGKLQMSVEERELRRSVTKLTLPPAIKEIGDRAFCGAALT